MLLRKGIVRKTFLFSALLIVLVILISFAAMYFIMPGHYLTQKKRTLRNNINSLSVSLRSASTNEECAALISAFSEANNVNIYSFDKDKALLPALSTPFVNMGYFVNKGYYEDGGPDSFLIAMTKPEDAEAGSYKIQIRTERILTPEQETAHAENGGQVAVRFATTGANDMLLYGEVGSGPIDYVIANGTLQPIDEAKGVILSLLPYVLVIAIAVGLVLSGAYARRISKPILQISDAALRMQRMETDAVSGINTKDELGQLSANLDALYASLLENIKRLKSEMETVNRLERAKTEMMQSASHELKTPIAALGGMLEGMMDNVGVYKDKEKYLAECKQQVDKLSMLVGEILGAAKADVIDDGLELSGTFADELVERAIAENMYYINEKKLKLTRELPSTAIVSDPDVLYRAISNLVSNAVRYTPENGDIRVNITGEGAERQLSIENECEPILDGELPKLFEPFYTRSYSRDKTKSGTGLGLYIVRRSLERLCIPYEAENTDLGFKISLMIGQCDDA